MNRRAAISGMGILAMSSLINPSQASILEGNVLIPVADDPLKQSVRKTKVLSDNWHFMVDISDIGEKEQWYANGMDSTPWSVVQVPQAWDTYEAGLWEYEGIAWYALAINPDDFAEGRRNVLKFNRVMFYSKIWMNGEFIGENIGGYLPFDFDVTRYLKPGQKNYLKVRVDNKPRIEWLPGGKQIEWIQYGGLLEKVELISMSSSYIDDCIIRTTLNSKGAVVNCIFTIAGNSVPGDLKLQVTLSPGDKKLKKIIAIDRKSVASGTLNISFNVDSPELWSPEHPSLYVLNAVLQQGGQPLDDIYQRFGIREVKTSGTEILLNGKPLIIKGVNRYDDYGRMGPNVPKKLLREEMLLMKSAGINTIRVHYPQSPELLDLYDEYGFVMMEEIPLNWWGINFFGETLQSIEILKFAKPELTKMIKRDKNHPCVIIWSMANESGTNNEIGIAAMRSLLRQAKLEDPTRLVTFVVSQSIKGHLAFEDADVVCVNMYNGIFSEKVCNHISDIEELGVKPFTEQLTEYRKITAKPLFITEFGCAGIKNIHGDASHTEEFQAAYIEKIWAAICSVKEISGGVLWCWADYFHRKYYIGYAAYGPYGVVTNDRKPKKSLQTISKMYDGEL